MILHDCKLHGEQSDNELFVVEGVSSADNIRRGRDATLQAVLALQGKPVNAAKVNRKRVEKHPELQALTKALGCGAGERFRLAQLRYKRVLLLFDPDADGIHCSVLVQIFLHQLMPGLIEAEKVYLVRAPMFSVTAEKAARPIIAYSENHYQGVCEYLRQTGRGDYLTTRFKGVASLSVELLRENCLNHETRKVQALRLQDVSSAMRIFG